MTDEPTVWCVCLHNKASHVDGVHRCEFPGCPCRWWRPLGEPDPAPEAPLAPVVDLASRRAR